MSDKLFVVPDEEKLLYGERVSIYPYKQWCNKVYDGSQNWSLSKWQG